MMSSDLPNTLPRHPFAPKNRMSAGNYSFFEKITFRSLNTRTSRNHLKFMLEEFLHNNLINA